jgi:hypothetical protein
MQELPSAFLPNLLDKAAAAWRQFAQVQMCERNLSFIKQPLDLPKMQQHVDDPTLGARPFDKADN